MTLHTASNALQGQRIGLRPKTTPDYQQKALTLVRASNEELRMVDTNHKE
jgi:succinylglutamate desuccinylase